MGLVSNAFHTSAVPPVLSYCFASILMTVVNKYVVSGASFSMTFLLLCMQSSVCIAFVVLLKKFKVISFRGYDTKDAKAWFPISFLLVNVIYTGSKSLQFLTIPVFTVFKNLTIILIAYGEVIWFGGKVTGLTFLSFIFMVLSSVIAAYSDVSLASKDGPTAPGTSSFTDSVTGTLSFANVSNVVRNLNVGYFWMLLNCLSSAAYVLSMRKRIKTTGFSDWDSMFYNNFLCIPILAVFSLLVEDWSAQNLSVNFPPQTRSILLSAIAFSGVSAILISYTTAWCIRVTSSTTYSMVGALNKLPVATSGMLFFNDPVTPGSVTSISVGFGAGLIYAVAKANQKKAEDRETLPMTNRRRSTSNVRKG